MLDLVAEIPDVPDVSGMIGRLREVVGRFGLESLTLGDEPGSAVPADVRMLLVGWNRQALENGLAPSEEKPPAAAILDPADFARLQPRRRDRSIAATASRDVAAKVRPDRWAVVMLAPEAMPPTPAETAVLRLLGRVVQERLDQLAERPANGSTRPLLSRRERECLQWTASGKTTWEIAGILEISQNTIDGYIASATRKLGAVNRTQAVAEALRRGLID